MASVVFGPTVLDLVSDYLSSATLKAMLVDATYTPDVDAHAFRSDVTGEITGTGYVAGGITLANVTITQDSANNRIKIDADDAAFGILTATGIAGVVVYLDTGNASTDRVLSHHGFAAASPDGVTFTYAWAEDGIGYYTYG